jgi:hypothetical protein
VTRGRPATNPPDDAFAGRRRPEAAAAAASGGGPGLELLVVAGEASGDLHGARLLAELRRLLPGLAAFGLGGPELRAAGLEAVADSSEVAVVGVVEVLKVLPRIRQVFAALLAAVDRRRPSAAVLIDFPDFNLRLRPGWRGGASLSSTTSVRRCGRGGAGGCGRSRGGST